MRGREGQRAFGRRSTDAGGVDDRRTGAIDRGDAPRGRREVHESRRRGAGIVAAEEEGGFLHVLLPCRSPTVTTVVSNDHSGTSSLGGNVLVLV